jgi:hypothetical protein
MCLLLFFFLDFFGALATSDLFDFCCGFFEGASAFFAVGTGVLSALTTVAGGLKLSPANRNCMLRGDWCVGYSLLATCLSSCFFLRTTLRFWATCSFFGAAGGFALVCVRTCGLCMHPITHMARHPHIIGHPVAILHRWSDWGGAFVFLQVSFVFVVAGCVVFCCVIATLNARFCCSLSPYQFRLHPAFAPLSWYLNAFSTFV